MLYHKIDPVSGIYIESVEAEVQPESSIAGTLPEITKEYTVAYIDGTWVSVLKPAPVIEEETTPQQ